MARVNRITMRSVVVIGASVALLCVASRSVQAQEMMGPPSSPPVSNVQLEPSGLQAAVPETPTAAPAAAPAGKEAGTVGENRPLGGTARTGATGAGSAGGAGGAGGGLGLFKTVVSLAFVVSLAMAGAILVKKIGGKAMGGGIGAGFGAGGRSPAGIMEVLGRYSIGGGQSLVLVRCDRRILLLGRTVGRLRAGPGSLTTLCEMTDAEEVASIVGLARDADGESMSARFRSLLHRFDEPEESEDVAGVIGRRLAATSEAGDRAELWDESGQGLSLVGGDEAAPTEDAVGSLRRRLDAMRCAGGGA